MKEKNILFTVATTEISLKTSHKIHRIKTIIVYDIIKMTIIKTYWDSKIIE